MIFLNTPINKATKTHNDYSYYPEDKSNTSRKHTRPKHDKSYVAHHFLYFIIMMNQKRLWMEPLMFQLNIMFSRIH